VVKAYFDTSALVAVYVTEAFSRAARHAVRAAGQVPFTPLHDLELGNALRLLQGRGVLTATEAEQFLGHVSDDRDAHRLVDTPVDLFRVFAHARDLSRTHAARLLCRSLDILHVASAVELGCGRLVSGDERQLALGQAAGLQAVDIKRPAGATRRHR
jgi:predicted nucleic acid-binding protein